MRSLLWAILIVGCLGGIGYSQDYGWGPYQYGYGYQVFQQPVTVLQPVVVQPAPVVVYQPVTVMQNVVAPVYYYNVPVVVERKSPCWKHWSYGPMNRLYSY
jgi:hypothetical protein